MNWGTLGGADSQLYQIVLKTPQSLGGCPSGSVVETPPAVQETRVRSLGGEDPWRRKWQPTPVFLPGEPHGQKCLVGHSPRGLTELDTTEAAEHTHQSLYLAEFGGFKSSGKVFLVFWIMLLHFRYLMNS